MSIVRFTHTGGGQQKQRVTFALHAGIFESAILYSAISVFFCRSTGAEIVIVGTGFVVGSVVIVFSIFTF